MKTTKAFLFLTVLLFAGSISAPVHAGGILDRVFNGGAKSLAKQTMDLTKKAADIEKQKAKLQLKAADIEKKTSALSNRDRRTFREEMTRLNVEGPGWLFDEAPGLLSGAEDDIDDDTPGGIGGLLGRIFGGGGNKNSGEASGGSSSGDSSGGGATASSGGILGEKTAAIFGLFDSKNYHMKAKTTVEGMEIITETYMKGDMMATVSDMGSMSEGYIPEMGDMSYRMVMRDGMIYIIYDGMKTIVSMPYTASNAPEEPVRTSGMLVTGSGTARFDGKNLPYEEYSLAGESSVKVQFFIDGNKPAGFRTIIVTGRETKTIDMIILVLDQNVPNSMFEIPSGYQKMEMPQMPDGH